MEIAPQVERRRSSATLRVLVADDERDTADSLALFLKSESHVVHTAYTGKDVLSAISLFRPDVVILDIGLPGVSGYAIAQAIRNSFTDIRRPLMIAITGLWKETPDRIVAEQVGFDHFLLKPCDPKEVVQLLARARAPNIHM